jgi:DNA-binding NarL/FixJ family response regulator
MKKQPEILVEREFEIIKFLAKGYTSKEISSILNIPPCTIKIHRRKILKKFNAKNSAEVIYKAAKMDLI